MLKERIYRELGRTIGTDADPAFWARNFGCDRQTIAHIFTELRAEGRAYEHEGKIYRS
jgi:hypothetical protein